jgi:hypothetical protein
MPQTHQEGQSRVKPNSVQSATCGSLSSVQRKTEHALLNSTCSSKQEVSGEHCSAKQHMPSRPVLCRRNKADAPRTVGTGKDVCSVLHRALQHCAERNMGNPPSEQRKPEQATQLAIQNKRSQTNTSVQGNTPSSPVMCGRHTAYQAHHQYM